MKSNRPMDPLNDLFIHHLFGSEKHKDVSLEFINAVFAQKGQPKIVNIEQMNPFNIASFEVGKLRAVDIKAKTSDDRIIIIEVQHQSQSYFTDRSLYYWAHNYQKQLKSAVSYETLNPVICINLLDFTLFPDIKDCYNCFHITEINNPEYILTEHLLIYFIELSKMDFNIELQNTFSNTLDQWCCYFKKKAIWRNRDASFITQQQGHRKSAFNIQAIYPRFGANG